MTCTVTYAIDLTGLHRPARVARAVAEAVDLWAPARWTFTRVSDGADVTIRFADDGVFPGSGAYWQGRDHAGQIVVQRALADTMPRTWLRYVFTHELGHVLGLNHGGDGVMAEASTPSASDIAAAACTRVRGALMRP